MTSREFFYLVARMRTAQTEYFRTHSSAALRKSKALEKEVDAEVARVKEIVYRQEHGMSPE